MPEMEKDIRAVADAIHYSDPMSYASMASYENDIKDNIVRFDQAADQKDTEKVSTLCIALPQQIK
jgi:hypothetical protein